MLNWACRLHEIGLVISHNSFHKHGAYLLATPTCPASPASSRTCWRPWSACTGAVSSTASSPACRAPAVPARRLAVLLRLSVLIHRGRGATHKPRWIEVEGPQIRLAFPDDWLQEHPLTQAEIDNEASYLKEAGFTLQYA
jgi:exopolyphosphatase / guanosine-5'-triphosphate,3'-diphosphate pyrophosphatase